MVFIYYEIFVLNTKHIHFLNVKKWDLKTRPTQNCNKCGELVSICMASEIQFFLPNRTYCLASCLYGVFTTIMMKRMVNYILRIKGRRRRYWKSKEWNDTYQREACQYYRTWKYLEEYEPERMTRSNKDNPLLENRLIISSIVKLVSKMFGLTFEATETMPSLLPVGIWIIGPPVCS